MGAASADATERHPHHILRIVPMTLLCGNGHYIAGSDLAELIT